MNDLFDNIRCINLEHRMDRWEHCLRQFDKYNFKAERFGGVEYSHPSRTRKQNGQIGCWLAHYGAMMNAWDKGYKSLLILEDDFVITEPKDIFYKKVRAAYDQLPEDWDMFYLSAFFVKGYDYEEKESYSADLYKVNTAFTLHSVAYSRRGLEKVLALMSIANDDRMLELSDKYESIDWFMVREFQKTNKCYAPKDLLCSQLNGYSDIENVMVDSNGWFAKCYNLKLKCNI